MHEFEARYKALTAGMEPKHVEAAELLVRKAVEISATNLHPLPDVLHEMLTAAGVYVDVYTHAADKAEILRLLGEVRSWQVEFGAMVKIRDRFVAELEEAKAERKKLQAKNGDLATKLRNAFTLRERLEAELEEAFEMLQVICDQVKKENT